MIVTLQQRKGVEQQTLLAVVPSVATCAVNHDLLLPSLAVHYMRPAAMLSGRDIAQLKAYVAAPASGIQQRLDSTVLLSVSHSNLSSRFMEIRLDLHVHLTPYM